MELLFGRFLKTDGKSKISSKHCFCFPTGLFINLGLFGSITFGTELSRFVNLGLFGSMTFGTGLSRLFRDRIVWSGIELLFDSLFSIEPIWYLKKIRKRSQTWDIAAA